MISPERTASTSLSTWRSAVADSVSEIPPEVWHELAPSDDPIYDYAFFQAMERTGIGPDAYRYILLKQGEQVRAVLPMCVFHGLALEDILGTQGRQVLRPLHGIMRRSLRIKALLCGHVMGPTGRVLRDGGIPETASHLLVDTVQQLAASMGSRWIGFTNFAPSELQCLDPALKRAGYFRAPGLPAAWLCLRAKSFEEYVSTLSRNGRSTVRRNLARFSEHQDVTIEVRDRFDDLVPAMMPLYQAVLDRAESRLDVWTPEFMTLLSTDARIPARAVVCWQRDRLVGFLIFLVKENSAVVLRIGLDYDCARELRLYQVIHYRSIQEMIRLGVTKISLTQNAYEAKRRMGCHLVPIEHAATHRNPVCRSFLRNFLPMAISRYGEQT
ncbi:GNAT family N-acetyltransferase [Streptomyces sp. CT34]|uniref:GNAT family N-acetyltransferase n=1 Tax=Streptomyces sp. CT34 TaxID=1553907 RepID=UPI001F51AADF|nr:GNAT family N-acetyltransferase [Streptomyces sp. CT34]